MTTRLLWYKAWLDTRTRFAMGLLVQTGLAMLLLRLWLRSVHARPDEVGFAPRPVIDFVQMWLDGAPPFWCLFAILLGCGGLVSQAASGGGLFMVALPVTRPRIVLARVCVVVIELYLLALLPLLLVSLAAPLFGRAYLTGDEFKVFVIAFSLAAGGGVFFTVPFFLSSLVEQAWVPLAVMLTLFVGITISRDIDPSLARFTMQPLLTASDYLNGGSMPWMGLADSLAVSLTLVALAVRNIARRDF